MLNLLHRPVLFPGTFGAHELFHLLVLSGSLAHYRFILKAIVSFAQAASEVFGRQITAIRGSKRHRMLTFINKSRIFSEMM